jgi:hypothetical protein
MLAYINNWMDCDHNPSDASDHATSPTKSMSLKIIVISVLNRWIELVSDITIHPDKSYKGLRKTTPKDSSTIPKYHQWTSVGSCSSKLSIQTLTNSTCFSPGKNGNLGGEKQVNFLRLFYKMTQE